VRALDLLVARAPQGQRTAFFHSPDHEAAPDILHAWHPHPPIHGEATIRRQVRDHDVEQEIGLARRHVTGNHVRQICHRLHKLADVGIVMPFDVDADKPRASTAGIGFLFLPGAAALSGGLALVFGRLRRHSEPLIQFAAWLCLLASVGFTAWLYSAGVRERATNESRDHRRAEIARDDVFLETKVWISDYGYDATLHAFDKSAGKLGVDRLDLLLLHQPLPSRFTLTLDAYRALEKLLADGKVRAIGVSDFMPEHLQRLLADTSVVPAVNQIEVHPYFQQAALQRLHAKHGILTQAWSPIGWITSYRGGEKPTFDDPTLVEIARQQGKSAAQVMLRWHLQEGRSAIPKSTKPARIAENFDVFDFELSRDQIAAIDALDTGVRGGPDPDSITLEAYGKEIPEP
jgi:diketogulonate reductase-like aldo/keto reductase